jgi:hypothetical protein
MRYLYPWFLAMQRSPDSFQQIMVEKGIDFDSEWASKESVVILINLLCKAELSQKEIWQMVYDNRKGLGEDLIWLFPKDPTFQRKRTWCHLFEAWYAIALTCVKHDCLHLWLCHFNLSDVYELVNAKQIIINGEVIVNGLHIEGKGVIHL